MSRPAGTEEGVPPAAAPSTERNVAIVREVIDALNAHHVAGMLARYSEDMEWLDVALEQPVRGRPAVGAFLAALIDAFPDLRYEPRLIMCEGDVVVVQFEMVGTHQATFSGVPGTGRTVRIPSTSIITFRDGMIVSDHCYFDNLMFLRQVGLMPSLEATFSPPGRAVLWLAVKRRQVAATAAAAVLSGLLARAVRGRRR